MYEFVKTNLCRFERPACILILLNLFQEANILMRHSTLNSPHFQRAPRIFVNERTAEMAEIELGIPPLRRV